MFNTRLYLHNNLVISLTVTAVIGLCFLLLHMWAFFTDTSAQFTTLCENPSHDRNIYWMSN